MKYRRLTLKLSGEALRGSNGDLFDATVVQSISRQVQDIVDLGAQVAIIVGGGNVFRGRDIESSKSAFTLNRVTADHIGMLGTVINALVFRDALLELDVQATVYTPSAINGVTRAYEVSAVDAELSSGSVALCAGGTGNPLFTTDTAATLRAVELGCDVLLKATMVDGVFDRDPNAHADANRFDVLSYDEAIARRLEVMDVAAFAMCRDHNLPLIVYRLAHPNALKSVVTGSKVGTLVCNATQG